MLTVEAAGIDTWSPAWYVRSGDPAARALTALCNVKVKRGWALDETVQGHRVGWFPASGLVFAEGHPGGDALGQGDELPAVLWRLEEELHDRGIPVAVDRTRKQWGGVRWRTSWRDPRKAEAVPGSNMSQISDRLPGFAGVRRLDATVDMRFDRGADGLAALAGVYALGLPRSKCRPVLAQGRGNRPLETVAFHGLDGRKMLARWYDKGVEASSAPRGTLIRPEDQRRFTLGTRRAVEELSTAYVRSKFEQRFVPLWQASKGVTVAGPNVLASKLGDLVEEGAITAAQAEKLAGFLLLNSNGIEVGDRTTTWRRKRALNEHGLALADGVLQEVDVDLHEVLDAALSADTWGGSG